jgi:hypothetical protein
VRRAGDRGRGKAPSPLPLGLQFSCVQDEAFKPDGLGQLGKLPVWGGAARFGSGSRPSAAEAES